MFGPVFCPQLMRRSVMMGLQTRILKPCSSEILRGRFMAHQESLPSLPVPPLKQTLDKYLKTVRPLVDDEQFKGTEKIVKSFGEAQGLGESLQSSLEEHADRKENWLSDWWLDCAYLESRASVVIYCSPSVSFPRYNFTGTKGQISQAAKVVAAILNYKVAIDNENLSIDRMGKAPLCMDQYYRILSSCRIPGLNKDSSECYARSWRPPRHILIIHNNHYFELDVYHEDGSPLSAQDLELQLNKIVTSSQEPGKAIGLLTARDRDSWGRAYHTLNKDQQNHNSFHSIHRAIFALCLDQESPVVPDDQWRSDLSGRCLHGGGSKLNSGNRWNDKTIQMIVDKNGGVGLLYEHSPAEGPPIAAMLDYVYKHCENLGQQHTTSSSLPEPKELLFNIPEEVSKEIEQAGKEIDAMIENLNLTVVEFKEFGKNFIKSQKLSPDSFIQIAFQLAYYRLHRKAPATYESGSLRQFRLGRTDTIRSCSTTSDEFAKAVVENKFTKSDLAQKLRDAIAAHKHFTIDAINGKGIDRHLLGLKLTAIKSGKEVPDLFLDDTYKRAMSFNLSTSQVPCQADLSMAFGPAVAEGYGICYNPKADHIILSVSSFKDNPDYDVYVFQRELFSTFREMRDMLLSTSSKL
ncbi:unnamed protein product [Clavelina lepadiformis]|uniref:Choline/carnitine acyltransferase domain-containing protein n=1 Tax=Clavelina lepadiformis TaxID=159417 RepID=A0ABP0F1P4_CLALP